MYSTYCRPRCSHKEYLLLQWNLSNPTHQDTREMCQIVQDVGILRCWIAQVPLYFIKLQKFNLKYYQ